MDNQKDDNYYINKIIDDAKIIVKSMNGISLDEFTTNELLNSAMSFKLVQISENSKLLSSEYKKINNAIPWNLIKGLRNRIVHDYGGVKFYTLYGTLVEDIPYLLVQLCK